jgi:hypothetical protein
MASKKYTLLALMMVFFVSGAFAQLAGTLDYSDSSKFSAKKIAQYNEWINGLPSSPFAPKPRDAWQISVFGGYAGIFGDVRTATGLGCFPWCTQIHWLCSFCSPQYFLS